MLLRVLEHKIEWNRMQVCMRCRSKVFLSFIKRKNYKSVKCAVFFLLIRMSLVSVFDCHNQCVFQDSANATSSMKNYLLYVPSTSILFVGPRRRPFQFILRLLSVVSILLEYKFLQGHYKCVETYLLHI